MFFNIFSKKKKSKEPKYSPKDDFIQYIPGIQDERIRIYINNRVLEQIDWYDKKSSKNQFYYKVYMIVSIILSAFIPIFTLLADASFGIIIKIIITTISSAITAISAIMALYNFRELWIQYRSNCEILKSVLHRFFTKCGEFSNVEGSKSYETLVMSCEEYLTKEFQTWVASNTPKSSSDQSSTNS